MRDVLDRRADVGCDTNAAARPAPPLNHPRPSLGRLVRTGYIENLASLNQTRLESFKFLNLRPRTAANPFPAHVATQVRGPIATSTAASLPLYTPAAAMSASAPAARAHQAVD